MASELEAARKKYAGAIQQADADEALVPPYELSMSAVQYIRALEAELSRTSALLDGALQWLTDNGYRAAVVNGRLVVTEKSEKAGGA